MIRSINFSLVTCCLLLSGKLFGQTGQFLGKPADSEIPGNPAFVSKAGKDPRYKKENIVNGVLTLSHIIEEPWADEPKGKTSSTRSYQGLPSQIQAKEFYARSMERTSIGKLEVDQYGLAINPYAPHDCFIGRGFFGQWGPNLTSDPLVVRYGKPDTSGTRHLELLVVQRPKDEWVNNQPIWALPGGMKDKKGISKKLKIDAVCHESGIDTAVREAKEETGLNFKLLANYFESIYQGYVNDYRATRHSWTETDVQFLNVHELRSKQSELDLPEEVLKSLDTIINSDKLYPKDPMECPDARWMPITEDSINALFASHGLFVRMAIADKLELTINPSE